jgi:hypothetical protein
MIKNKLKLLLKEMLKFKGYKTTQAVAEVEAASFSDI